MSQTVCILLDDAAKAQLTGIAGDRSRPLKHILRARIILLSAERLSVHDVARHAGVSRPAVCCTSMLTFVNVADASR